MLARIVAPRSRSRRASVVAAALVMLVLAAPPASSDRDALIKAKGLVLVVDPGRVVDAVWKAGEGELIIELTETTIGSDKFQTSSPGHKSVGELTLRGAKSDVRPPLVQLRVDGLTVERELPCDLDQQARARVDKAFPAGRKVELVTPIGDTFAKTSWIIVSFDC